MATKKKAAKKASKKKSAKKSAKKNGGSHWWPRESNIVSFVTCDKCETMYPKGDECPNCGSK